MKIFYIPIIVIAYMLLVIIPNYNSRKEYLNCALNSIPEGQVALYGYLGNIRNDQSVPKTCTTDKDTFQDIKRSMYLPQF